MARIQKYLPKGPGILSLLALFLIFLTLVEINNFWLDGVQYGTGYMLRPALGLAYTFCWISACYLKKWGMLTFVGLSAICYALSVFIPEATWSKQLLSLWQEIIPLTLILSMLLMLFFKKFK